MFGKYFSSGGSCHMGNLGLQARTRAMAITDIRRAGARRNVASSRRFSCTGFPCKLIICLYFSF